MIDYLDDIICDIEVFFRVELQDLTGPEFFKRAWRVANYDGVMRKQIELEWANNQAGSEHVDADVMLADPQFGKQGVFSSVFEVNSDSS